MFVVDAFALLPHPPATVFAAASSLEGVVRWQSGAEGVRRPRGRSARTGPLVLLYRALGRRHLLQAQVSAYEPPGHFAYRAVGPHFVLGAALRCEPAPLGTRVALRVTVEGGAPDGGTSYGDAAPAFALAELRRLVARRTAGDLPRLAAWVAARERAVAPLPAPSVAPSVAPRDGGWPPTAPGAASGG